MPVLAEKLNSPTLRQQVVVKIRDAVIRGMLHPGEKLVERELAAKFGASLTVIREAIVQLESEGIIIKRPNASTSIVQLSSDDILKIYAVRRELEGYALVEAARNITREEGKALEACHKRALESAAIEDADAYIQSDLAWHQTAWTATKNEFLETALRRLVIPLFGFSYIQLSTQGFNLLRDAQSHSELSQAIIDRNPEGVMKAFPAALLVWEQQSAGAAAVLSAEE